MIDKGSTNLDASTLATDDVPAHIAEEMKRTEFSRREFLKLSGLGAMAAIVASCRAPVEHVVPRFEASKVTKPGLTYNYASTCNCCSAGCGVLMKVRDGRPIKAEGNPDHPLSNGGLCGKGQASLMALYDPDRLRGPLASGKGFKSAFEDIKEGDKTKTVPVSTWQQFDRMVMPALKAAPAGSVRLMSGTINSPTTLSVIAQFLSAFPGSKHVMYDAVSNDAIAKAHGVSHGTEVIPHYDFTKADVIVSFGADFLGTWISPVEFSNAWASRRRLTNGETTMSRHVQFEAAMSMTGSNADARWRLADSERGAALVKLAQAIAKIKGSPDPFDAPAKLSLEQRKIESAAKELWGARGKSLVVCGSNDVNHQLVVNLINDMLGNYAAGATINLAAPSQQKLGRNDGVDALLADMKAGKVGALIVYGANPVYDLPNAAEFSDALKKVATRVAIADRVDETAAECNFVAPDHHWLESWNDYEPVKGLFSLSQPTVMPLHDTRAGQESLLVWAGQSLPAGGYREIVKANWTANILGGASWEKALSTGVFTKTAAAAVPQEFPLKAGSVSREVGKSASEVQQSGTDFEVVVYESVGLGDGRHANNPWLHEMPDPVSKVTWDNYASLSPKDFDGMGLKNAGDMVSVTVEVNGQKLTHELPAFRQPGQAEKTVAIALGYGRSRAGRMAAAYASQTTVFGPVSLKLNPGRHHRDEMPAAIGKNAYPFIARSGVMFAAVASLNKTSKLALSQIYDSERDGHYDERKIVKEATLAEWKDKPKAGNEDDYYKISMWSGHDKNFTNYDEQPNRWGVAIDLNTCTGCSACVVACMSENNVPVVGKDEVWRRRDMHWMRIDRYYDDSEKSEKDVSADPTAKHQPMFCQHCENAPCETVCPVGATAHSEDGLNTQAYNRCVGTRYCANNCPYKVRRFNWFNYSHEDKYVNLALNPDVSIRTRGVMEKCTLCVQRTQEVKLKVRKDGRTAVADSDNFQTACQQTCPTQAIIVGNINDKNSKVSKLRANPRGYGVIEEIGIKPVVTYLTKIKNTEPAKV